MKERVDVWARGLARVVVLTALVASGLWQAAAMQVDLLLAALGQDLHTGPQAVVAGTRFRLALQGVAGLRSTVARGVEWGRPLTRIHHRAATRVDRLLQARLVRF